jgi:hypothetical protein
VVACAPWLAGVFGGLELSAAFLGLPEVRLVGLKDASYFLGLVPNNRLEKPVSPSEGCAYGHSQLLGSFPDGQALLKAFTMLKKLLFRVKVGKRCVCRCVERLRAVFAAVALDSPSESVLDALEAIAVGATRSGYRRVHGAQRMGVLVQAVRRRP